MFTVVQEGQRVSRGKTKWVAKRTVMTHQLKRPPYSTRYQKNQAFYHMSVTSERQRSWLEPQHFGNQASTIHYLKKTLNLQAPPIRIWKFKCFSAKKPEPVRQLREKSYFLPSTAELAFHCPLIGNGHGLENGKRILFLKKILCNKRHTQNKVFEYLNRSYQLWIWKWPRSKTNETYILYAEVIYRSQFDKADTLQCRKSLSE